MDARKLQAMMNKYGAGAGFDDSMREELIDAGAIVSGQPIPYQGREDGGTPPSCGVPVEKWSVAPNVGPSHVDGDLTWWKHRECHNLYQLLACIDAGVEQSHERSPRFVIPVSFTAGQ